LGAQPLAIGDLILTEVLQDFTTRRAFITALALLTSFTIVELGGRHITVQAARNSRLLRGAGVTHSQDHRFDHRYLAHGTRD